MDLFNITILKCQLANATGGAVNQIFHVENDKGLPIPQSRDPNGPNPTRDVPVMAPETTRKPQDVLLRLQGIGDKEGGQVDSHIAINIGRLRHRIRTLDIL